jgi:DNA mismatch repair protein MutS2
VSKKPAKTPSEEPSESIKITDRLDLHGFYPEQVSEIMETFIDNAICLKIEKCKVIHGKGKSRLKFEVIQALKSHPRVKAYYDAPFHSGGWGATVFELEYP